MNNVLKYWYDVLEYTRTVTNFSKLNSLCCKLMYSTSRLLANWADYWKSQPRKLCEFCKCWIADNKPSISFHEGGKRHKENVAKRLAEISKKSAADAKSRQQVDSDMRKMEKAAMKAYMKDIEENADFTSQLVLMDIEEKKKKADEEAKLQAEAKRAEEEAEFKAAAKRKKLLAKAAKMKWYEAKSDEGHSYYWHVDTNETRWEPPEGGYFTAAEQKLVEKAEKAEKKIEESKEVKRKEIESKQVKRKEIELKVGQTSKRKQDEELVFGKKKKKSKAQQPVNLVMGPAPKAEPYGTWKTIETLVRAPVDLELPQKDLVAVKVPAILSDKPKIQFHEKKVTTLCDDEDTKASFSGFKKKSAFRGNVRQRLDTDD